jgi:hypothetical protein
MLGEIRIYPVNEVPGADTLFVTLGATDWREGRINLDEARAMVAARTARWIGERPSDALIEAHRKEWRRFQPLPQAAEEPPAYIPPATDEERLAVLERREAKWREAIRPPEQAAESLPAPVDIMPTSVTEFLP